jgi:predicted glycoside hydrolase/deacetylase ChbG (UPF0249 family)
MVNMPLSEEAARLADAVPQLSVGLHVDLPKQWLGTPEKVSDELQNQFARFEELMGRPPTHLDSHHNVHRDSQLLPHMMAMADRYGLPLREHSPVRYFSKFYGQWGGASHPESIGVASLVRMLATEIGEGITELSCHPGFSDAEFSSGYAQERAVELRTLCDPAIRRALAAHGIQLASYRDLERLRVSAAAGKENLCLP